MCFIEKTLLFLVARKVRSTLKTMNSPKAIQETHKYIFHISTKTRAIEKPTITAYLIVSLAVIHTFIGKNPRRIYAIFQMLCTIPRTP
jgi:hypothetical protein